LAPPIQFLVRAITINAQELFFSRNILLGEPLKIHPAIGEPSREPAEFNDPADISGSKKNVYRMREVGETAFALDFFAISL